MVQEAIDKAVMISRYCGPDFQHAHGIAIYFPWAARDLSWGYRGLKFAQDTGWADFLEHYLVRTRRLRRAPSDNARPRRLAPDVEELIESDDLSRSAVARIHGSRISRHFGSKAALHFASKVTSPYGSREGSPYGSRTSTHYESKSSSHYESKVLAGMIMPPVNFQNAPDGFYRQAWDRDNVFIDRTGEGHPDPLVVGHQ